MEIDLNREAEDRILRWCRSNPKGHGLPAMRNGHDGLCCVVDVARFNAPRIAEGRTWVDVAITIRLIVPSDY